MAALNICQTCLSDFENGRKFRGKHDYVKWDPRSKRVLFLDFEESLGVANESAKVIKKTQREASNDDIDGETPPEKKPKVAEAGGEDEDEEKKKADEEQVRI